MDLEHLQRAVKDVASQDERQRCVFANIFNGHAEWGANWNYANRVPTWGELEDLATRVKATRTASGEGPKVSGPHTLVHNQMLAQLQERAARATALEDAIRKHRDQRGDDRCWSDDDELYDALGEPQDVRPMPPPEVMLKNCQRFIQCRTKPGQGQDSSPQGRWLTGAEIAQAQELFDVFKHTSASTPDPDHVDAAEKLYKLLFTTSLMRDIEEKTVKASPEVPSWVNPNMLEEMKKLREPTGEELRRGDPRALLFVHCTSEHAIVLSPEVTLEELVEYHRHEHAGPGTIRDHTESSRRYSMDKIRKLIFNQELVPAEKAEENPERGEKIVHILRSGVALCGFDRGTPGTWSPEHKWTNEGAVGLATCHGCLELFRKKAR